MRSIKLALLGATLIGAMAPAAADAQRWRDRGDRFVERGYDRGGPPPGYYDRGGPPRGYGRPGYGPPPGYRGYGRRSRCDRGTGGTIIGAIAGGLLGNSVAGRGDRGIGTILGAGAGALAGRAVDRDC